MGCIGRCSYLVVLYEGELPATVVVVLVVVVGVVVDADFSCMAKHTTVGKVP